MTCVVAYADRGRVYLAGDSAVTDDVGDLDICREPKVWRAGPLAVGHAGSDLYSGALRWRVQWPTVPRASADLDRWANVDIVRQLGTIADEADDGDEDSDGESVIVAVRGRIYLATVLGGGVAVTRPREDYLAIGSGAPFAKAVLDYLGESLLAPKTKMRRALEGAARRRTDVCKPWVWVQV